MSTGFLYVYIIRTGFLFLMNAPLMEKNNKWQTLQTMIM